MTESQAPPKLSVVEAPPGEQAAPPRRGARRLLPWLLGIAAVAFAWLWLDQLESTRQLELRLEERISLLETDLSVARQDLLAWEARMQDVRGGIDQVAQGIESLRALAALAPGEELASVPPAAAAVSDDVTTPEAEAFESLESGVLLLPPAD